MNMDTQDNQPDKDDSKEIVLTVAYVKTEPSTSAFQYNTSNSEEKGSIHEQNLMDTNVITTAKKEECTNNTSEHMAGEELDMMNVKEKSLNVNIDDHDMQYTTDLSQYGKIGESNVKHIGGITSTEHIKRQKMVNTKEKPYKCDTCGYKVIRSSHLREHYKLRDSGEKPYMCASCGYSTTRSGGLKKHKLVHSIEKPYKCDVCDYSSKNL